MRRIPALLLTLALGVPLIAPLLSTPRESALPACCRRDGEHGCARMREAAAGPESASAGRTVQAVNPCPELPGEEALPHYGKQDLIPGGVRGQRPCAIAATSASPGSRHERNALQAWRERGPPERTHASL